MFLDYSVSHMIKDRGGTIGESQKVPQDTGHSSPGRGERWRGAHTVDTPHARLGRGGRGFCGFCLFCANKRALSSWGESSIKNTTGIQLLANFFLQWCYRHLTLLVLYPPARSEHASGCYTTQPITESIVPQLEKLNGSCLVDVSIYISAAAWARIQTAGWQMWLPLCLTSLVLLIVMCLPFEAFKKDPKMCINAIIPDLCSCWTSR